MCWGIDEISSAYWMCLKLMDLFSPGFLCNQISNEGICIESKLQSGLPKMLLAAISWKATSGTQMVGRCDVWCYGLDTLKEKSSAKHSYIQTSNCWVTILVFQGICVQLNLIKTIPSWPLWGCWKRSDLRSNQKGQLVNQILLEFALKLLHLFCLPFHLLTSYMQSSTSIELIHVHHIHVSKILSYQIYFDGSLININPHHIHYLHPQRQHRSLQWPHGHNASTVARWRDMVHSAWVM